MNEKIMFYFKYIYVAVYTHVYMYVCIYMYSICVYIQYMCVFYHEKGLLPQSRSMGPQWRDLPPVSGLGRSGLMWSATSGHLAHTTTSPLGCKVYAILQTRNTLDKANHTNCSISAERVHYSGETMAFLRTRTSLVAILLLMCFDQVSGE